MDHPHVIYVVVVEAPMVGIPVMIHGAVFIDFDGFPFRNIVDIVYVVCDLFFSITSFGDCFKCVIRDGAYIYELGFHRI